MPRLKFWVSDALKFSSGFLPSCLNSVCSSKMLALYIRGKYAYTPIEMSTILTAIRLAKCQRAIRLGSPRDFRLSLVFCIGKFLTSIALFWFTAHRCGLLNPGLLDWAIKCTLARKISADDPFPRILGPRCTNGLICTVITALLIHIRQGLLICRVEWFLKSAVKAVCVNFICSLLVPFLRGRSVIWSLMTFLVYSHVLCPIILTEVIDFIESIVDFRLYGSAPRKTLSICSEAPPELQCPVCRELLHEPVVVDGFAFCRQCFAQWHLRSSIHPITGLATLGRYRESHIHRAFAARFAAREHGSAVGGPESVIPWWCHACQWRKILHQFGDRFSPWRTRVGSESLKELTVYRRPREQEVPRAVPLFKRSKTPAKARRQERNIPRPQKTVRTGRHKR
jgi:hypothetical protein